MATIRKYDFESVGVETGTQPDAGTPSANSDLVTLEYFNNNSGGGGGSLAWRAIAPTAPQEAYENNELVYQFSGTGERLYAAIKVPQSYNGAQIKLYSSWYHSTAGVQVDYQSTATLIRPGTDLITSTTNQETSTAQIATSVQNQLESKVFNLTDASGQINAVTVAAGAVILLTLQRTDANSGIAKFLPNGTELKFN